MYRRTLPSRSWQRLLFGRMRALEWLSAWDAIDASPSPRQAEIARPAIPYPFFASIVSSRTGMPKLRAHDLEEGDELRRCQLGLAQNAAQRAAVELPMKWHRDWRPGRQ